jgi:hypothetical protein
VNKDILPVLDEISAVLKKHDMVGLVVVGNPTHCNWRMEVEASWSCAWLEKDGTGRTALRVRSKLSEYPNREAQRKTMETTVGTFVTFNDVVGRVSPQLEQILIMLSKHVDFIGKSTDEK